MKIDNEFVNYWFNVICAQYGALTHLRATFNLSEVEGFSLLGYLLKQEDVSKESLASLVADWRTSTPNPEYGDITEIKTQELNRLLPVLDIRVERNVEPEPERVFSALSKEDPDHSGALYVIIFDIALFYYTMMTWRQKKLWRYVGLSNHPMLYKCRRQIRKISSYLYYTDKYCRFMDNMTGQIEDGKSFSWRYYSKGLRLNETSGWSNLLRLMFFDGHSFDENSESERASAILWLKGIREYCSEYETIPVEISWLIAENNIEVENPYFEFHCDGTSFSRAMDYLNDVVEESEVAPKNEGAISEREDDGQEGGRKEGTWRTPKNTLDDVIWEAIFAKIWNGGLKADVSSYYFANRTAKQRMKDITLLGAAHLYKALEQEGYAKKFGESGTKNAFYKTLHKTLQYRRQSLDEYMLLMDLIEEIDVAIENEHLNDRHKDIGWEEKAKESDKSVVKGMKREMKGKAADIWAPSLAAFRKEHSTMYRLLGKDILLADYTVEREIEEYPDSNIHPMIKTSSWLRRELGRQYSELTRKKN